jgi:hypothetical protein
MDMYTTDDFSASTLFWGALIFVGLFIVCLLGWKSFQWLRDRWLDSRPVADQVHVEIYQDPAESWACQAVSRPAGDNCEAEFGGFAGMSEREQEAFFSTYAPRKVRRAMRARRRSREMTQKRDPH